MKPLRALTLLPLALVAPALALCQGSDDCANAQVIQVGDSITFDTSTATESGLSNFSFTGPDLFFEFTWPDFEGSSIWIESPDPQAAFDLGIDCIPGSGGFSPIINPINLNNPSYQGITFIVRVGSQSGQPVQGVLNFGEMCSQLPIQPDSFEENDTCPTAVPILPGTYAGVTTKFLDSDFYSITVPSGFRLDVGDLNREGRPVNFQFRDASSCSVISGQNSGAGYRHFRNLGGTSREVVVDASVNDAPGGGCARYEFEVALAPDPCFSVLPDPFEDNDTLATATVLLTGTYSGLSVGSLDPDYYAFDLNPGEAAFVTIDSSEFLFREFYDPTGAPFTGQQCMDNVAVLGNMTSSPGRYTLGVTRAGDPSCAMYDMTVVLTPTTTGCTFPSSDSLEPNAALCCSSFNSVVHQVVLTNGIYPDLTVGTVFSPDTDRYGIFGTGSGDVTVTAEFDPAFGVVNLGSIESTEIGCFVRRLSTTQGGRSTLVMPLGGSVEVWCDPVAGSSCNRYTLTIENSTDSIFGVLATEYCTPSVPNSTGLPARISVSGSGRSAPTFVTSRAALYADQLPPNSFGYFISGPMQGFVPTVANSQGSLCLSGAIGRHVSLIFNAGPAGTAALLQDFAAMPTPAGTVAVPAGMSWNFQAWYRDSNPSVTSNFTNGVNVLLQ